MTVGYTTTNGTAIAGSDYTTTTGTTATSITATTPAHAAGAVNVMVTTAGGNAISSDGYTFADASTIPTLSEWMLLALMAMVAMVGCGALRS